MEQHYPGNPPKKDAQSLPEGRTVQITPKQERFLKKLFPRIFARDTADA